MTDCDETAVRFVGQRIGGVVEEFMNNAGQGYFFAGLWFSLVNRHPDFQYRTVTIL